MGKHSKLPTVKAATPSSRKARSQPGDAYERLEAHLLSVVAALEAAIASGDGSPAIARESASVARALLALNADKRAAEKHAAKNANAITPSMLLDYLRRMTVAERAQLRRDLDAIDRQQQSASIFG